MRYVTTMGGEGEAVSPFADDVSISFGSFVHLILKNLVLKWDENGELP